MKLFVLVSCYETEGGCVETRTPSVFKKQEKARASLREEFESIDKEDLDETMDSGIYEEDYADVYFKNGGHSVYEIYEVEVE